MMSLKNERLISSRSASVETVVANSAPAESLRPLWQEVERLQLQLTEYTNKQQNVLQLSLQTQPS